MLLIRAVFHALFCWNATVRVPDLAFFAEMRDYVFPAVCTRCGDRRLIEGRDLGGDRQRPGVGQAKRADRTRRSAAPE